MGWYRDGEVVGSVESIRGKAVLRGFYFDFAEYPVSKNGLSFSFEHHDYNSTNIYTWYV